MLKQYLDNVTTLQLHLDASLSLMDTEILLAFKAGRAFRRGATSSVEPSATKGAIVLSSSNDDGLLHFIWRNRATGENEEVRRDPKCTVSV